MLEKTRRAQRRQDTSNEIKAVARRHMQTQGAGALSLRAIAAEMQMTAPAIYRYFQNRDALITALIVDAFSALAQALEAARAAHSSASPVQRLLAVLLAYRAWAVEHPTDFQLIYGTPIPGYEAPRDVTVPAVVRGFSVIVGLIDEVLQIVQPPAPYNTLPPALRAQFEALIARDGYPISVLAFYLGVIGWTQLHGIIMLELFGHLPPVVGDSEGFYHAQVVNMMRTMGIEP
ncbi:MAG: TetR/AcrR family transcriptional regulator [Chloroflexi bacterium]|nr:TetR/AcrR family transcriptional regulator [Chloroflexota bacterium]